MSDNPFASRPHAVACGVAAAYLLVAVWGRQPYAFYVGLRWVVMGCGLLAAYQLQRHKVAPYLYAPLVLAVVLFNPLLPFHYPRSTWAVLDLVGGAGFVLAGVFIRTQQPASGPAPQRWTRECESYLDRVEREARERLAELDRRRDEKAAAGEE